jgi:hypothetical protein
MMHDMVSDWDDETEHKTQTDGLATLPMTDLVFGQACCSSCGGDAVRLEKGVLCLTENCQITWL